MHKSYLKYAGGKSRILPTILDIIHDCDDKYLENGRIREYYEPFLGSAVVAMNVNAIDMTLSDINWDVVTAHEAVINNPNVVIERCRKMWRSQSINSKGKYDAGSYLGVRHCLNSNRFFCGFDISDRVGAMVVYLNKFGFNGMFRYNKKGEFNVPVGGKSGKNPSLPSIPEEEIHSFAEIMAGRDIVHSQWQNMVSPLVDNVRLGPSVVYFDPPYVNLKGGEIQYSMDGFTLEDQRSLAYFGERARNNGHRVIISNHDLDFTREIYKNATRIETVNVSRSVSSKSSTRGKVSELIAIYE